MVKGERARSRGMQRVVVVSLQMESAGKGCQGHRTQVVTIVVSRILSMAYSYVVQTAHAVQRPRTMGTQFPRKSDVALENAGTSI